MTDRRFPWMKVVGPYEMPDDCGTGCQWFEAHVEVGLRKATRYVVGFIECVLHPNGWWQRCVVGYGHHYYQTPEQVLVKAEALRRLAEFAIELDKEHGYATPSRDETTD
jgi:hypothetical protein